MGELYPSFDGELECVLEEGREQYELDAFTPAFHSEEEMYAYFGHIYLWDKLAYQDLKNSIMKESRPLLSEKSGSKSKIQSYMARDNITAFGVICSGSGGFSSDIYSNSRVVCKN